ncbi:hypothetical protein ACHAXR_011134 [Thalassiosira sp. AJA248-18]
MATFLGTVAIGRLLSQRHNADEHTSSESDTQQTSPQHHSSLPTPAQALDLIRTRRSIFPKQFTGKNVPQSVVSDMLEAARWAPSHHITEPWRFVVFESQEAREELGILLGELYKTSQVKKSKPVLQAKIDKKRTSARLSSHIVAICVRTDTKNPFVEEVSSVAMAVQNMHLLATCHGVGAYWSSGGVHAPDGPSLTMQNPQELSHFLSKSFPENESLVCLGWMYVGDYYGDIIETGSTKKWPAGRRSPIEDKVTWR